MSDEFTSSALSIKRRMNLTQLNDDALLEIFSRMSARAIAFSKGVCTKWNGLMSPISFIHLCAGRPLPISGIFFQQHEELHKMVKPIFHILLETGQPQVPKKVLNFLPEEVCVMSSSNGLLCCRSFTTRITRIVPGGRIRGSIGYGGYGQRDTRIYVCNPSSKEFKAIRPSEGGMGINIGLTYDPVKGDFQLVTIDFLQLMNLRWQYSVTVFSSKTWSWKNLGVVFSWNSQIHRHKHVFAQGRFHWLTTNHYVMTFDMQREIIKTVKLPGPIMEANGYHGVCLGSSGGHLVYLVVHPSEIRVWTLVDYRTSDWFLEKKPSLDKLYHENMLILRRPLLNLILKDEKNAVTQTNAAVIPLAFVDGIFYLVLDRFMYTYDFKTKVLKKHFDTKVMKCDIPLSPIVLPYADNLVALNFLNGIPEENV